MALCNPRKTELCQLHEISNKMRMEMASLVTRFPKYKKVTIL
jgi:hypothetical protein